MGQKDLPQGEHAHLKGLHRYRPLPRGVNRSEGDDFHGCMVQDWGGRDSREAQGVIVMDYSVLMVLTLCVRAAKLQRQRAHEKT